jgi:hypothetical protein
VSPDQHLVRRPHAVLAREWSADNELATTRNAGRPRAAGAGALAYAEGPDARRCRESNLNDAPRSTVISDSCCGLLARASRT